MNLKSLRVFLCVADLGHVTRAARQLHLPQAAVDHHLGVLAHQAGVPLLERERDGAVTLTPAGRLLREDAHLLVALGDAALARCRQSAAPVPLRAAPDATAAPVPARPPIALRLGAVAVALLDPVPLLLEGMAARADAPAVQVRRMRSAEQAQALRDGVLDLGLLHPPLRHPEGLRLRVIGSMAMSVVLWAEHPLADRARLSLDDLAGRELLLPSAAAAPLLRAQIDRWRAAAPPSMSATVFDGNADAVIERVRARQGIAFMPDALRQQSIAGVVQRPLVGQPLRLEMAVSWRDGETRPEVLALAAMVCQLAEQRRQVSAWLG